MKKTLNMVLASIAVLMLLVGCKGNTPTAEKASTPSANEKATPTATKTENSTLPESAGLTVERAILGKKDKKTDKITPVEDGIFKKGETICLVLLNTGKFKKGADGKNSLDLDVEIKDSKGQQKVAKKGILGASGQVNLPDDIAQTPFGSLDTEVNKIEPGEYTFTLTIYDKISGQKATESQKFKLQ